MKSKRTATDRLQISLYGLALAGAALLPAAAQAGSFAVMSYNVRGLPPPFIEDRTTEIAQIGPLLEDFHTPAPPYVGIDSVVGLQEVFHQPYYNTLTGAVAYDVETPKDTGGLAGIGDGLVIFSDFANQNLVHVDWAQCFGTLGENGSDCDTAKGYTYSRIFLENEVFFDLYTLHADAGQDSGSQAARRNNILQLAEAINTNSPAGTPVIVLGDTNSLYTRFGTDNLQLLLLASGLTDVWVQLERESVVPSSGSPINGDCDTNPSSGECELVDKILYRDGSNLVFSPQSYTVLDQMFSDNQGDDLSDHFPVAVKFDYAVVTTTTVTTSTSSSTSTSTSTTTTLDRPCGDPTGPLNLRESANPRAILSSDALFVLRVAVGTTDCPLCTCDVNDSGTITAADALRVLKKAVGQNITLTCPPCP